MDQKCSNENSLNWEGWLDYIGLHMSDSQMVARTSTITSENNLKNINWTCGKYKGVKVPHLSKLPRVTLPIVDTLYS